MDENLSSYTKLDNKESKFLKWVMQWQCLLTDVFLVSASLTCIFRWFSYGGAWNMGGFVLSASAAAIVHFFSLSIKRIPSINKRSTIAFFALTTWIILLPVLMRMLGYNG